MQNIIVSNREQYAKLISNERLTKAEPSAGKKMNLDPFNPKEDGISENNVILRRFRFDDSVEYFLIDKIISVLTMGLSNRYK